MSKKLLIGLGSVIGVVGVLALIQYILDKKLDKEINSFMSLDDSDNDEIEDEDIASEFEC